MDSAGGRGRVRVGLRPSRRPRAWLRVGVGKVRSTNRAAQFHRSQQAPFLPFLARMAADAPVEPWIFPVVFSWSWIALLPASKRVSPHITKKQSRQLSLSLGQYLPRGPPTWQPPAFALLCCWTCETGDVGHDRRHPSCSTNQRAGGGSSGHSHPAQCQQGDPHAT